MIAWQAGSASACYFSGTLIQGLAVLNYPQYDFQRWHGTLLVYAVVLLVTFFNTILARFLPQVEMTILVIHLAAFVGILVPLVYLAPHGTASDVFAQFLQRGGYESKGVTFLVGIVTTNLAMLGADGAVHMSEEIHNSTTVVPWVMVGSIAINGALGFGMLIAVLFCIGDIDAALASPTGYPFMEASPSPTLRLLPPLSPTETHRSSPKQSAASKAQQQWPPSSRPSPCAALYPTSPPAAA